MPIRFEFELDDADLAYFREIIERKRVGQRGIAVSDLSGTIASPLIPWNVNGAFAAGTLGVATFAYAQYAVLLWVAPLLLLVLGLAVYRRDQLPSEQAADDSYQAASADLPERRTSV